MVAGKQAVHVTSLLVAHPTIFVASHAVTAHQTILIKTIILAMEFVFPKMPCFLWLDII